MLLALLNVRRAHSLTWFPTNLLANSFSSPKYSYVLISSRCWPLMGCRRSVAMAMIVSLFCSQMSDIPEGSG